MRAWVGVRIWWGGAVVWLVPEKRDEGAVDSPRAQGSGRHWLETASDEHNPLSIKSSAHAQLWAVKAHWITRPLSSIKQCKSVRVGGGNKAEPILYQTIFCL